MTITINGTTGISGVDGSAGTPSLQGQDTNTGFFYGTDILGFSTGGSERMRLDASGNLGLGVTPSAWNSSYKAIELSGAAVSTLGGGQANLSNNVYVGSGGQWISKAGGAASLYQQNSGTHVWYQASSSTAGNAISFTQAMTLDASGNLGVGLTALSNGRVNIQAGTSGTGNSLFLSNADGTYNPFIQFQHNGINGIKIVTSSSYGGTAGNLTISPYATCIFETVNTERMRIDSSGNVGIGGTSPVARLYVTGDSNTGYVIIDRSANPPGVLMRRANGTQASPTQVLANDFLSFLSSQGYTSSSAYSPTAARIDAYAAENFTSTANGSYITFNTTPTGSTTIAERMRIDSSGIVYIGGTSGYGSAPTGLGVKSTTTNWQVISLAQPNAGAACVINYVTPSTTGVGWDAGAANGSSAWMFRYNASQISNINASTGVYTATSDVNRKKDFEESNIGLAEVMRLKPTLFRMLVDDESTKKELGFIAQDVKSVIPQAYVEDGDFIGLQDRPIIAALTKAIQELTARIEQLEAK